MTGPEVILDTVRKAYNVPDDVMSAINLDGDRLSVGDYNIVYDRGINKWMIVSITDAPAVVLNDISLAAALEIMVEFAYDRA